MPLYQEYLRKEITLDFGSTDTTKSEAVFVQGELMDIHLRLSKSASAASATGTLTLEDDDSYQIYNSTAKNIGSNYNLDENRFLAGKTTVKVTLDAAPGDPDPPNDPQTAQAVVVLIYRGKEIGG